MILFGSKSDPRSTMATMSGSGTSTASSTGTNSSVTNSTTTTTSSPLPCPNVSNQQQPLIKIGHYILGETLGVGTFGKVKSKYFT